MRVAPSGTRTGLATFLTLTATLLLAAAQSSLPAESLHYGRFRILFRADGTLLIDGHEWKPFTGHWTVEGNELTVRTSGGVRDCGDIAGRYRFRIDGTSLSLDLIADECGNRRMVLRDSTWRPAGSTVPAVERRITHTSLHRAPSLPKAGPAAGSWPSFRGPQASGVADGQHLPDRWDPNTGEHILWRTPIPGIAHASPVVWGNRVFVTTAISSDPRAMFKPGVPEPESSTDRSRHKWVLYALDKHSGTIAWERVAFEGAPRDRRHLKSTYANATPATDGRIVVAWFGSQGVYAYDMNGAPVWQVDLGRIDMGAYGIPNYEWGPASSPVIWNDLVLLQCDTQADSFVLALDAATGQTVWKADRVELSSWGTPTVVTTPSGPELVTNASNYIRGYDPGNGRELWRLGGSSQLTAPTPFLAGGLIVVASGRAPERPLFAIRPGGRGDITLKEGATSSDTIAWSRPGRGSYMPTPVAYQGILYVLANNGVFDAYDLQTGAEIYRERLTHIGSGFSASPVAADGRLYLTSEDGEMLVVAAGREFRLIARNNMGELLMATPALSEGVMYVRSAATLFAIGRRRP
jgi:outer membrane protein assembly factor BamB